MANALYRKYAERMLSGGCNFSTSTTYRAVPTLKAALVKNTYPQNLATDEFYTSISPYVLNTTQTLTNKAVVGGVFDADDVTYSAVTAGDTCEGVVIYEDTGNTATSPLIAYIDQITGFPLLTNGGDVVVQWDNGTFKIFSL